MKTDAVPLIDMASRHAALRAELLEAASRVLDSGTFIQGPEVRAFEAEFSAAHGGAACLGLSNGTDALELALKACGVGPGDEVLVPDFTFIATASAVCAVGATPRFVDVSPDSLTLDPEALARAVGPKVKAAIPVHLYGCPADMDRILAACAASGLRVVEDCAQAHLARSRGEPVGGLGDAGAFSFYPTKNLGALGDAGALLTRSEAVRASVASLRDAGRAKGERYRHASPGRNSRLDELQAAFLRVKLRSLEEDTRSRERWAAAYRRGLAGLPLVLPPEPEDGSRHVYHLFTVRAPERDRLARHLAAAGIGSGVYYPIPLHRQPAFRDAAREDFPVSEKACGEVLSLPMYPELGLERVERVCAEVRRFFT